MKELEAGAGNEKNSSVRITDVCLHQKSSPPAIPKSSFPAKGRWPKAGGVYLSASNFGNIWPRFGLLWKHKNTNNPHF